MAAPDPVIGIVGLGHVGRALAAALAPHFRVLRCDPVLAGSQTAAQLAHTRSSDPRKRGLPPL